jgi:L-alanine-DL-glutamate epimerase-like enolase superfamily enzyme
MAASGLRVSAFEIPTSSPEADGTLDWNRTVLVTVEVTRGTLTGFGYTYADVATAHFITEHFGALVAAASPEAPATTFAAMERSVRNVGREGVAATAIAAVDMALWDLKARLLDRSLAVLLGVRREAIDAYGSGGFTSYSDAELRRALASYREERFSQVKIKIGRGSETIARVRTAREVLGPDIALFVDANGAYDPREALSAASAFAPCGVSWFEEPVSSDDLEGMRFVREHVPPGIAVAAGEYGYSSRYFARMLEARAVDVLQADATRCGVTGFLTTASLCEARGVPLSAHCGPTIHAQLGLALPGVIHVEYFHDHARIEAALFDGFPAAREGRLRPDTARPGLGIEFKRADAAAFAVFDRHVVESSP